MRELTVPVPSADVATLQAYLAWANASILQLVQAVDLLDRSVHQFEATHPATTSEQIQLLLQQIRQSHPGPLPAPRPAPAPPLPCRCRKQRRPRLRHPSAA
jgi:hypothetical protein